MVSAPLSPRPRYRKIHAASCNRLWRSIHPKAHHGTHHHHTLTPRQILHVEQEAAGSDTTALQSVLQADTRLTALRKQEADATRDLNSANANLSARASEVLKRVWAELQDIDADTAPARAGSILKGLGFNEDMITAATSTFSGGWFALARVF